MFRILIWRKRIQAQAQHQKNAINLAINWPQKSAHLNGWLHWRVSWKGHIVHEEYFTNCLSTYKWSMQAEVKRTDKGVKLLLSSSVDLITDEKSLISELHGTNQIIKPKAEIIMALLWLICFNLRSGSTWERWYNWAWSQVTSVLISWSFLLLLFLRVHPKEYFDS